VKVVLEDISHNSKVPNLAVPEFIDPVFAKTSPKRSFSITENERFGLVFVQTGSINSGTELITEIPKYFIRKRIISAP
jgi:hypothetical protein